MTKSFPDEAKIWSLKVWTSNYSNCNKLEILKCVCVETALSSSQYCFQMKTLRNYLLNTQPLLLVKDFIKFYWRDETLTAVYYPHRDLLECMCADSFIFISIGFSNHVLETRLVWQTAITPCVASVINPSQPRSSREEGGRFESEKICKSLEKGKSCL